MYTFIEFDHHTLIFTQDKKIKSFFIWQEQPMDISDRLVQKISYSLNMTQSAELLKGLEHTTVE